jgi:hypothetical protein
VSEVVFTKNEHGQHEARVEGVDAVGVGHDVTAAMVRLCSELGDMVQGRQKPKPVPLEKLEEPQAAHEPPADEPVDLEPA